MKKELKFNNKGEFKILNLSDIQDFVFMLPRTKNHIESLLKKIQPDLVVLTGDNIYGPACKTKDSAKKAISEFMNIFERENIDTAMVFGNHDDQDTDADKAFQMEIYESYDCFLGEKGEPKTGCGTYNLPIFSKDKSKISFNLWFTDSGTYGKKIEKVKGVSYASVSKEQIEWYEKTAEALKAQNGGKPVPAINFQHIIVPEIYSALESHSKPKKYSVEGLLGKREKRYFSLKIDQKGVLHESPCPPFQSHNEGQFDAFLRVGDVLATVSGHDHVNTFEVNFKGIEIINTPTCSFRAYHDETLGSRVFTLKEDGTFETKLISYLDATGDKTGDLLLKLLSKKMTLWKKVKAIRDWGRKT